MTITAISNLAQESVFFDGSAFNVRCSPLFSSLIFSSFFLSPFPSFPLFWYFSLSFLSFISSFCFSVSFLYHLSPSFFIFVMPSSLLNAGTSLDVSTCFWDGWGSDFIFFLHLHPASYPHIPKLESEPEYWC